MSRTRSFGGRARAGGESASFPAGSYSMTTSGARLGFSVQLEGGAGGGGNPVLGSLCSGSYTVNATQIVGPLRFPKGSYRLYIPPRSGITRRRASVLFTRFLAGGGRLPAPWRVRNQTATIYKLENPTRSAFRIEPLGGA